MLRFRLMLNRLTDPDDGWGGRLHLVVERPETQARRVVASMGVALRPPGRWRAARLARAAAGNAAPGNAAPGNAVPGKTAPGKHGAGKHGAGHSGPLPGDDHDNFRYRVPRDLAVTPTPLRRILIVGSCAVVGLPDLIRTASPPCPADYVLFNNLSELPETPPLPVGDYDFQLVQIPIRSVLPDHLYFRAPSDPEAWRLVFEAARERLAQFLDAALRWNTAHGLLTFVTNFLLPQQNAYGRLLPRYDFSNPVYMIERLNQALHEELHRHANAHVLDIDQIAASFGRRYIQDDGVLQGNHGSMLGDADHHLDRARIAPVPPVSRHYTLRAGEFMQALWAETVALFRTVRQIDAVKLVIVDLDDTLWRGVVAEIGADALDPVAAVEGWPLGLIEALGYLKRRGVLLAIVSKNDEATIAGLWDSIMQGRLSMDDFAVRRINWEPKAENVDAVIRAVNVLPRSVVFVDDNPVERAAVLAALPDIRVLGADPYYLRRILLWAPETQVAFVSEESARRTEMIQAGVARETTRQRLSRPEFLASLGLSVRPITIADTRHKAFARAFELINKTNQFNTTGRRWTQEEARAAFDSGTVFHAFEVADRFSRYGLVGVVIAGGAAIEQMVMSCRVVGLDVEIAAVADVLRRLRAEGAGVVSARLVETDANLLCRTLFDRCGFVRGADGVWVNEPDNVPAVPAHTALV
jgi:FkbH-like protein